MTDTGASDFGPRQRSSVPPVPISGGTMFLSKDERTLIAADPDRDVIWLVDLERKTKRSAVELLAGDEPGRGVEDDLHHAHVVLRNGGSLVTIDIPTGSIVDRRPICAAPRGIDFDRRTRFLHVACQTGELLTLLPEGGAPIAKIELAPDLRDVVVADDGIYVSRFRSAELLVVTSTRGDHRTIDLPSGNVAWRMIPYPRGVAVLYQTADTSTLDVSTPSSTSLYGDTGGGSGCSGLVQSTIATVLEGEVFVLGSLVGAVLAVDLAYDPRLLSFAVASPSSAGTSAVSAVYPDGSSGCLFPSDETTAPTEAIAVGFSPGLELITQLRNPPTIRIGEEAIELERGDTDDRADFGHAVFHRDSSAGITCASCHPEGGDDGRTWMFDFGPRRTQSLRTELAATAPYHWDGDMADLHFLMDEVFTGRMGGPLLTGDELQLFRQWLESIRPWPREQPSDLASWERGRALFEDPGIGCAGCHGGSAMTNNATTHVGTLGYFQVPSLIGVSRRAPFLHDGCAPTLRDRFLLPCGGGDRHGVTSHLGEEQLDDLVGYLESL